MSDKTGKIKSIQGLRAIFCFIVFAFHAMGMLGCRETFLGGFFEGGNIGVCGFFILAGFLDTYLSNNKKGSYGTGTEIKNKIVKFIKKYYPFHLLFLVLAMPFALWSVILKQKTILRFIAELLAGITLTQDLIPITGFALSFNDVSWYLSASLLMIPLTVLAKRFIVKPEKSEKPISLIIKIALAFFLLLGISVLVGICVKDEELLTWFLLCSFFTRTFDYVIGMFLGKLAKTKQFKNISPVVAFCIFALLVLQLQHNIIPVWLRKDVIYVPFISVLILGCVSGESTVNKILSLKPMVYLGDNSFYYYISHYVFLKYLFSALSRLNMSQYYSSNLFCVAVLTGSFIAVIVFGEIVCMIRRLRTKKAK